MGRVHNGIMAENTIHLVLVLLSLLVEQYIVCQQEENFVKLFTILADSRSGSCMCKKSSSRHDFRLGAIE